MLSLLPYCHYNVTRPLSRREHNVCYVKSHRYPEVFKICANNTPSGKEFNVDLVARGEEMQLAVEHAVAD